MCEGSGPETLLAQQGKVISWLKSILAPSSWAEQHAASHVALLSCASVSLTLVSALKGVRWSYGVSQAVAKAV